MTEVQGIQVTFLDQTGAKSIKARIAPTVAVSKIIPNIITKMSLPITAPDGQPMSYSLDHKEGGKRLQETQTLPDAGVKEGDHLIVYPEIVAGGRPKSEPLDWKDIQSRTVPVGTLIKLARDLRDEDGENVEYERALAELVTDAAGLSMGFKRAVARKIGLKANID